MLDDLTKLQFMHQFKQNWLSTTPAISATTEYMQPLRESWETWWRSMESSQRIEHLAKFPWQNIQKSGAPFLRRPKERVSLDFRPFLFWLKDSTWAKRFRELVHLCEDVWMQNSKFVCERSQRLRSHCSRVTPHFHIFKLLLLGM